MVPLRRALGSFRELRGAYYLASLALSTPAFPPSTGRNRVLVYFCKGAKLRGAGSLELRVAGLHLHPAIWKGQRQSTG